MARTKKQNAGSSSTATIGLEVKLWLAAKKLRHNRDTAESKGARRSAPATRRPAPPRAPARSWLDPRS